MASPDTPRSARAPLSVGLVASQIVVGVLIIIPAALRLANTEMSSLGPALDWALVVGGAGIIAWASITLVRRRIRKPSA